MSTEVLSVRLPGDVKARLDALASSTGRPATFYVRQAVAEHLDELEYAYTIAARAEDVRSGARSTKPLAALLEEMGITPEQLDTVRSDLDERE